MALRGKWSKAKIIALMTAMTGALSVSLTDIEFIHRVVDILWTFVR